MNENNPTVQSLSAQQFKEMRQTQPGVVVDVRTAEEFASGHLEGALNADYRSGEVEKQIQNWDKEQPYYLHCAGGARSGKAAQLMAAQGFKKVYNIGGFGDLKNTGLPTE